MTFTDTSTGPITGWLWDFGDGTTSSAQHPTHTYTTPGTYTVTLTVFGEGGTSAQVTLAWDASTAPNLGGYKLYYGTSSGTYPSSVDVGPSTTYTLTGLTPGQTYYFAITAYDTGGTTESDFSNEVSATLAAGPSDTASAAITVTTSASVPPAAPGRLRFEPL